MGRVCPSQSAVPGWILPAKPFSQLSSFLSSVGKRVSSVSDTPKIVFLQKVLRAKIFPLKYAIFAFNLKFLQNTDRFFHGYQTHVYCNCLNFILIFPGRQYQLNRWISPAVR